MPTPQNVPFDKWTEDDAAKALPKVPDEYAANDAFVHDDHWQQGNGWIGPRPAASESGAAETMALIEQSFVSRNAIGEVVDRHTNGVVGREPAFQFVPRVPLPKDQKPTDQQIAQAEEIRAIVAEWWDRRKIGQILWDFAATLCWAERAVLRIFIPNGLLITEGQETRIDAGGDLKVALDHVYVMQPTPKNAGVAIDADSQQEVGIWQTEIEGGGKVTELTYVPGVKDEGATEGAVVLRHMGALTTRTVLVTGGRLLMFQARRPLLITKPVQQQQRALNLAMTIVPRNITTGGFLERILLNAQMPGTWEVNETTGKRTWKPGTFSGGAGTVQYVVGVKEEDEEGNVKRATPSVVFREPVAVDNTFAASDGHYRSILDEVDQAHVLLNALSETSGRAREQARNDFKASLTRSQRAIEPAVVWLVETPLALAEFLAGSVGQFTNEWRAVAACNIDEGPLPQPERAQNVAEYEAGLISRRSSMSRNNVADPQSEIEAINNEEHLEQTLGIIQKRAEIMALFVAQGLTPLEAAIAAGWDEADAKLKFPNKVVAEEDNPDAAGAFGEEDDAATGEE